MSKPIRIFRHGSHRPGNSGGAIEFSESDLQRSAEVYDPKLHEAPLVLGHPKHDDPAYGWVGALDFSDGALWAGPRQVSPALAGAVERGEYRHVSPSFYLPDSPRNPVPGSYYLRHVGFLGAQPPAVKGLGAVEFADGESEDDFVTVEFGEPERAGAVARILRRVREFFIEQFGMEKADAAIRAWELEDLERDLSGEGVSFAEQPISPAPKEESPMDPEKNPTQPTDTPDEARFAEREQELSAREKELAAREAKIAEQEATRREAEIVAFCEQMEQEGKLLPREREGVAAFMRTLQSGGSDAVEFGEGDDAQKLGCVDFFKKFVSESEGRVDFSEIAPPAGDGDAVDFSDPTALADAASAYIAEQQAKGREVSSREAVRHVKKQHGRL